MPGTSPSAAAPASDYETAVGAHAEYYSALAAREGPRLKGAGFSDGGKAQLAALRVLKVELENVYGALEIALSRDNLGWLLRIAEHLWLHLDMAGEFQQQHGTCLLLLSEAQQIGSAELELAAQLGLAQSRWRLGQYAGGREAGQAARAVALQLGNQQNVAEALTWLGLIEHTQGNFHAAQGLLEPAVAGYQQVGDSHGEAVGLSHLGNVEHRLRNYAAAREKYSQSLTIRQAVGDRYGEASALGNLGNIERLQGNSEAAWELYSQARDIARELGLRHSEALTLNNLGVMESQRGNLPAAHELYLKSLEVKELVGDRHGAAVTLSNLSSVEFDLGNFAAAQEWELLALHIQRSLGNRYGEAISLWNLAVAEYRQGNFGAAREPMLQGLAIQRGLQAGPQLIASCVGCGALLARLGRLQPASRILHGAATCAAGLGYVLDPQAQSMLGSAQACLAAALACGEIAPDELAQWKAQGEAMSLDELAEFTLAALSDMQADS